MRYLLDSNVCIRHFRSGGTSSASQRLLQLQPNDAGICSIVRAELLAGAYRMKVPQQGKSQIDAFCKVFPSLPFDDIAADQFGRVHAQLAASGTPIGAADLMIAAIALAQQLIVVTNNVSEFQRVPGLQVEDW
jgi:tRNA(fMet)-specific endonuclease VapC